MTGFEPGSSGIGSNRSANCATTTSQLISVYPPVLEHRFAHKTHLTSSALKLYRAYSAPSYLEIVKVHHPFIASINIRIVLLAYKKCITPTKLLKGDKRFYNDSLAKPSHAIQKKNVYCTNAAT